MAREKIELTDSLIELVGKMAEGNPGALTVCMKLRQNYGDEHYFILLNLDDMNIRGSQIWVGYKDYCGEDIKKFAQAIQDRDMAMVNAINKECYRPELVAQYGDDYSHRARRNRFEDMETGAGSSPLRVFT